MIVDEADALEDIADRLLSVARTLDEFGVPTPVAAIATNAVGEVIFWSQSATELYGWTADEVLGRSILGLTVGPEDAAQADEIMALVGAGETWRGEFRCRRKDGTPIDVHVIDVPFRNRRGEIVGICGFSLDVSMQRHELEDRIARAQEILDVRLGAAEEERRRIVADLHDGVGQLLSSARTDLAGLRASAGLDADTVERLDVVVGRLDAVAVELRRICADLLPPSLEFAGLATALAEDVARLAERSGLVVDLDVTGYDGGLTCDAALQVFRIAQAAIVNVERHAGASAVTVTLMSAPDGDDAGPAVVLEISDDGVGIGADDETRSAVLRREVGLGAGIGLEIMRHRAGLLGGDLAVTRIGPDGGTRVRLVVPLPPPPWPRPVSAARPDRDPAAS